MDVDLSMGSGYKNLLTRGSFGREETVSRLCPFEQYVRAVLGLIDEKTPVEGTAFGFKDTGSDLYSGFAKHTDACTVDLAERVDHADNNFRHTFLDNETCAGGSAPIMGTRLKAYVKTGSTKPFGMTNRGKSIDFGMAFTATGVETFTDNLSVVDNDRTNHGIRGCTLFAAPCKLKTTAHPYFIFCHKGRNLLIGIRIF